MQLRSMLKDMLGNLYMMLLTLKDIRESERLKKEVCESCMERLRDIFTDEQLEKFEFVFYSAVKEYILKRKD